MTQSDIDRAVARATGETVGRVQHMGFTLVVIPPPPLPRRCIAGSNCPSAKAPPSDGRSPPGMRQRPDPVDRRRYPRPDSFITYRARKAGQP